MPCLAAKSQIVEGDVLDILPKLREGFDVIIADPPYNIGKDFGKNHDSMNLADYVGWSKRWIGHCRRLLAPKGVMYIYGFPEILAHVAVQFPLEQQRWLQWHYTNKAVPSSRFWQRSHESILCLWRDDEARPALEIDRIREPYTDGFLKGAAGRTRPGTDCRYSRKGRETVYQAHEGGALPRDVIKIPALAGGAGWAERWFMCRDCKSQVFPPSEIGAHRSHDILKHPTQKPAELSRRLLRSRVNGKPARALIPFAGSGSECVVAQEEQIDFLGIELNPTFVEFAKQWLGKACQPRDLLPGAARQNLQDLGQPADADPGCLCRRGHLRQGQGADGR